MYRRSDQEGRIVVFTPTGRDAQLILDALESSGLPAVACRDHVDLLARLDEGVAAVVIAEEALPSKVRESLVKWLETQPPWSDLPFVVLTSSGRPSAATMRKAKELSALGNVTFLERPVRPDTLRSSLRAAVRARLRQYEMRRRQETLTRVNADLEQFAHSASHDLQEPLRNVSIYSDLLSRRYGTALDEQGREFLGYLKTGAVRMESMVRDLLAYTQAASIDDEMPNPTDVTIPLEAALSNLSGAMAESRACVTYGPMPAVRMRPVHLQQLFQNLIGNAIKYRREESPRVHVVAAREDGHWLFSVADNGMGIQPEYKERIFGIFKRLHTSDKYAGTGIGLAICQRIAERYRGRIWVESQPGVGSTFYFTVPA